MKLGITFISFEMLNKAIVSSFKLTFLNKCDDLEKKIISEYYQRCFGEDLPESSINVSI